MTTTVSGIINDGVGGYEVDGAVRDVEGQKGVQHLLLGSICSLQAVSFFGGDH